MQDSGFNRRRFPRVKAPVLFKSTRLFSRRTPVVDIGMGGMRVFSDDPFKVGQSIDIELLLPTGETLECTVKVVWLGLLPEDAPAKFDVGLELMSVKGDRIHLLAQALEPVVDAPRSVA
jgi:hypothetical protein